MDVILTVPRLRSMTLYSTPVVSDSVLTLFLNTSVDDEGAHSNTSPFSVVW